MLAPLLVRDRAVMRAHELFLGELVEPAREALAQAPAVHEQDRAAMRANRL